METSAKANINIENAFYELAQAILTKTCGREQTEALDRIPLEGRSERQSGNRCCWLYVTQINKSPPLRIEKSNAYD